MNMILQTIYFMISYVSIIFLFFFGLNFLTKGFMWSFLRVKASKGKKLLTIVHSVTDIYFVPGMPEDGGYKYKTRNKTNKTLADIPDSCIFPMMSVFAVNIDENKDVFYSRTLNSKPGPDAAVIDRFVERAIVAPKPEDKLKVAMVIGIMALIAICLVTAFIVYGMSQELTALKALSGNI